MLCFIWYMNVNLKYYYCPNLHFHLFFLFYFSVHPLFFVNITGRGTLLPLGWIYFWFWFVFSHWYMYLLWRKKKILLREPIDKCGTKCGNWVRTVKAINIDINKRHISDETNNHILHYISEQTLSILGRNWIVTIKTHFNFRKTWMWTKSMGSPSGSDFTVKKRDWTSSPCVLWLVI